MFMVFALMSWPPCPNRTPSWLDAHPQVVLAPFPTPGGRGHLHGLLGWFGVVHRNWEDQAWTHHERPQICTEVSPFWTPAKASFHLASQLC